MLNHDRGSRLSASPSLALRKRTALPAAGDGAAVSVWTLRPKVSPGSSAGLPRHVLVGPQPHLSRAVAISLSAMAAIVMPAVAIDFMEDRKEER